MPENSGPNPFLDPQGSLRKPESPQIDETRFDIPPVREGLAPPTERFPAVGVTSRPRTGNTGPNQTFGSQRRARTGPQPVIKKRFQMSRGSTIASWALAFIVVLYLLNLIGEAVKPNTTVNCPGGFTPTPTATVNHSPAKRKLWTTQTTTKLSVRVLIASTLPTSMKREIVPAV